MAQYTFGNFPFPDELIKQKGSDVAPNQRQTLDSYTDMNGLTHPFPVPHTKTQIEFTTLEMSGDEMRAIWDGLTSNYINQLLRDVYCTYYDDEYGKFKTGHFYLDPSIKFPRSEVNASGIPTHYDEMKWLFIEL